MLNTPVGTQAPAPDDATNTASDASTLAPPAALAAIAHAVAEDASTPLPEDQLMLIQTLIGAWPLELAGTPDFADHAVRAQVTAFVERVAAWQEKALRESKRPSDWSMPNERYEATCRAFLDRIMDPAGSAIFVREAATFVAQIAPAAAVNGLVQAVLHCTVPGIPDVYQGSDRWDFSLVDPDNRRPVDYPVRSSAWDGAPPPTPSFVEQWRDGAVKQAAIATLLAYRAQHPALFARGRYVPLAIAGPRAAQAIAFLRDDGRTRLLVVAASRCASVVQPDAPRIDASHWDETVVVLPEAFAGTGWSDLLTGKTHAGATKIALGTLLGELPVAVSATPD